MAKILLVSDLMTAPVVSVHVGATLADAERTMRMAAIRHLPVTDGMGKLVGLITHRTLLTAWVGHGDPKHEKRDEIARSVPVEMMMQRNLVVIKPDQPAARAARLLEEQLIGCLPVVGEDDKLLGILTETDFVRFARIYLEHAATGRAGSMPPPEPQTVPPAPPAPPA
ncbi:MAG: CBS domain-containing protein [Byssovorax sp.]